MFRFDPCCALAPGASVIRVIPHNLLRSEFGWSWTGRRGACLGALVRQHSARRGNPLLRAGLLNAACNSDQVVIGGRVLTLIAWLSTRTGARSAAL